MRAESECSECEEAFRDFAYAVSATYITQMLAILAMPLLGMPGHSAMLAVFYFALNFPTLIILSTSPTPNAVPPVALSILVALAAAFLPEPAAAEVGSAWAYAGLAATVAYFALAVLSFFEPAFAMLIVYTFPFPLFAAYLASRVLTP